MGQGDTQTMGETEKLKARYDAEYDILYLSFGNPVGVVEGEDVAPGILVEYDEEDTIVGIEIFGAKEYIEGDSRKLRV